MTGPLGTFPQGKLNDDDAGGLNVGFKILRETRQVLLDFGTPVAWMAAGADDTMAQVRDIRELVHGVWGELPYDAATLPIKIEVDLEKRVIFSRMPITMEVLVANPEVLLAWAEKLEQAVETLVKAATNGPVDQN
jgi:hypothetical protein